MMNRAERHRERMAARNAGIAVAGDVVDRGGPLADQTAHARDAVHVAALGRAGSLDGAFLDATVLDTPPGAPGCLPLALEGRSFH